MTKPNVVFITMDECKASALSSYGNNYAYTPITKKLADEGVQFNQSYTVMPKCVPSRCAMITGRYPHSEGHRTLPGFHIQKNERNLATDLRLGGWRTGLYGKNHVVDEENVQHFFDEWQTKHGGVHANEHRSRTPVNEKDEALLRGMYLDVSVNSEELHDTFDVEEACNFIERNKDVPFFLSLDISSPHPPYFNVEPFVSIIDKADFPIPFREPLLECPSVLKAYRTVYNLESLSEDDWRKISLSYASMVSHADRLVGVVRDKLEKLGLLDNTLFIVTADHGDFAGEHGTVEKYDTMFYQCLINTPLLMRFPKSIPANLHFDCLVENIDIPATIYELCGLGVPSYLHGKSLTPIISGKIESHRDVVFSAGGVEANAITLGEDYNSEKYIKYPNYKYKQQVMVDHNHTMYRRKMVFDGRHKLIFRVDGETELYDLQTDPRELTNQANNKNYDEIISILLKKLLCHCIETETEYPVVQTMYA